MSKAISETPDLEALIKAAVEQMTEKLVQRVEEAEARAAAYEAQLSQPKAALGSVQDTVPDTCPICGDEMKNAGIKWERQETGEITRLCSKKCYGRAVGVKIKPAAKRFIPPPGGIKGQAEAFAGDEITPDT